jgi:hypothetical protein
VHIPPALRDAVLGARLAKVTAPRAATPLFAHLSKSRPEEGSALRVSIRPPAETRAPPLSQRFFDFAFDAFSCQRTCGTSGGTTTAGDSLMAPLTGSRPLRVAASSGITSRLGPVSRPHGVLPRAWSNHSRYPSGASSGMRSFFHALMAWGESRGLRSLDTRLSRMCSKWSPYSSL